MALLEAFIVDFLGSIQHVVVLHHDIFVGFVFRVTLADPQRQVLDLRGQNVLGHLIFVIDKVPLIGESFALNEALDDLGANDPLYVELLETYLDILIIRLFFDFAKNCTSLLLLI